MTDEHSIKPMKEQLAYANLLVYGNWIGLALMAVTYIIYLAGILEPNSDIQLVVANWDKGVDEFLAITNAPHGWGWVALIGKGDFLNFTGIALLAGITIVCYGLLVPGFFKAGDKVYGIIAILEILVLLFAASGIVGGGGH